MRNKYGLLGSALIIIGYFLSPVKAFAAGQEICQAAGTNFSALCRLRLENNTGGVVGTIVQIILILGVIVALFYFIMGGVKWITSGGDRNKIAAARSQLIAALAGLLIAFFAFAVVNYVLYFFTGQSMATFRIPRLID